MRDRLGRERGDPYLKLHVRDSIGNKVSGTVIALYGDSSYTCELSITYKLVKCTLEIHVTLYVNYILILKNCHVHVLVFQFKKKNCRLLKTKKKNGRDIGNSGQ